MKISYNNKERISKLIANYGTYSRRQVDFFIKQGKVFVNSKVAVLGQKISLEDKVVINGEPIVFKAKKYYFILNKPKGFISERTDKYGKTALSLIENYQKVNLFTVGRLDVNTTGLIIITNDGYLANQLSRPENKIKKTYLVWLKKPLTRNDEYQLKHGIQLDDGVITRPINKLKLIANDADKPMIKLTISEGKKNQIKRMFLALDNEVINLKRVSIGAIQLDDLPLGKYRTLQKEEIYNLLGITSH